MKGRIAPKASWRGEPRSTGSIAATHNWIYATNKYALIFQPKWKNYNALYTPNATYYFQKLWNRPFQMCQTKCIKASFKTLPRSDAACRSTTSGQIFSLMTMSPSQKAKTSGIVELATRSRIFTLGVRTCASSYMLETSGRTEVFTPGCDHTLALRFWKLFVSTGETVVIRRCCCPGYSCKSEQRPSQRLHYVHHRQRWKPKTSDAPCSWYWLIVVRSCAGFWCVGCGFAQVLWRTHTSFLWILLTFLLQIFVHFPPRKFTICLFLSLIFHVCMFDPAVLILVQVSGRLYSIVLDFILQIWPRARSHMRTCNWRIDTQP